MIDDYAEILDTYPDTAIAFGESCFSEFECLVSSMDVAKLVVFSGKKSVEANGAWSKLLHSLTQVDVEITRFNDIEPEPCIQTVEKMIDFLEQEQPDQVVALGGGSVLDAAKAAFLTFQAGGTVHDYFGVNKFSSVNPGRRLKKVICFPTTSGTGSEATPYSNIVDRENAVKKLISEVEIIPEYSFVMPSLALSMPLHVTLATACDALAHSMEGFLNVGQDDNHPMANDWAYKSIELIVNNLPWVLKDENDLEARAALAAASCLGGMVIRYKSTGLPHLCSFSWFGRIEHGIAVSILLPHALEYYIGEKKVQERVMELAGIFGGSSPAEVTAGYRAFLTRCGVPKALREFSDINPELLKLTAQSAGMNKMKLDLAPKPVPLENSVEILSEILDSAWKG